MNQLTQFASTASEGGGDLFSSLGIDWKLLILQTIAFLVLLFLLKKLAYPPLNAMLNRYDDKLQESQKAVDEAKAAADESAAKTEALLKKARDEASDIVLTAKDEATAMIDGAKTDAKSQAEHILAQANDDIALEIELAKKSLANDMVILVSEATEKVAGVKVNASADKKLIEQSLKSARDAR